MKIYKKAKCKIHGEKPVINCMHCGYACGWNDYRKLMLSESGVKEQTKKGTPSKD